MMSKIMVVAAKDRLIQLQKEFEKKLKQEEVTYGDMCRVIQVLVFNETTVVPELQRDALDAARYRWLLSTATKQRSSDDGSFWQWLYFDNPNMYETVTEAIDRLMKPL